MSNSIKMGVRRNPYAFTELGVAMLSSVLNSKTAIQINMGIMRAFVAVRQLLLSPPINPVHELQREVKELKEYIEEVFADYNDINDDTRMQLELIRRNKKTDCLIVSPLTTGYSHVNKACISILVAGFMINTCNINFFSSLIRVSLSGSVPVRCSSSLS